MILKKHFFLTFLVFCPMVYADDTLPSPGNLPGPYAFLGIHGPADDAAIVDKIVLDVFGDYTRDNFGGDTYALRYSIEVPFGDSASIMLEHLYETWSLPSEVAQDLGISDSGSNLGDFAVRGKFLFIRESDRVPAMSLKLVVKAPAGSDENARYMDTTAVLLSVLGAKNFHSTSQSLVTNLRLITELGIAAWDDSDQAQNDALKWGIATLLQLGKPHRVRIGAYGLVGRRDNGDRPSVAQIEWEYGVNETARAFIGAEAGLNEDADDYSIEAGLRFRFNSILPWGSPGHSPTLAR